jgi:hypothetical protein
MDTSAGAARKATTEPEKERYRKEGRCYQCGNQGHLARNCAEKKSNARSAQTTSDNSPTVKIESKPTKLEEDKIASVRNVILGFSEEEWDAFLKAMNEGEDSLDFQNA